VHCYCCLTGGHQHLALLARGEGWGGPWRYREFGIFSAIRIKASIPLAGWRWRRCFTWWRCPASAPDPNPDPDPPDPRASRARLPYSISSQLDQLCVSYWFLCQVTRVRVSCRCRTCACGSRTPSTTRRAGSGFTRWCPTPPAWSPTPARLSPAGSGPPRSVYLLSLSIPWGFMGWIWVWTMDQISIKTPNPKCRLFLKIDQ